ncbi:MAG: glycosyltransferase family 4 protein [Pseudomonadota bacterium]
MIRKNSHNLLYFVFVYWHDDLFKKKVGGPIKVFELTKYLNSLGNQVYLFIPKIGYPERQTTAKVFSVPFIDLPILRFVSYQIIAFFWALRLAFSENFPDVIYVRIMWSFIPMILGRILAVPIILEINDSPHRAYTSVNNNFKKFVIRVIDKISFYLSDHVLPVTKKIAINMHRLEGIPWKKITVLPSGANTEIFFPMDKRKCCLELGFDQSLTYIGFVGTIFHYQGIDILIEAAPMIIRNYPNVRFLIVGDGPMKNTLENMVIEKSLQSYFIFTGYIPYECVPSYCAVMTICVAPFHRSAGDSSPVKVFDYLACGKPVVVSDVGENGVFFKNSGAVVLVPPEDPAILAQGVNRLLTKEALHGEMGRNGREFIVRNYSRRKNAEVIVTVASKILASRV